MNSKVLSIKIYAIVVTYNGSKWIDKCISSLIKSTIPLNILAIDNASTDHTPNIIKENYPLVEVIETGENLGFGKANNIGLKKVLNEKADFAFLINQDAWIEPDTIEKLVNISKENPKYGIISPIHLNGKGDAIDLNFQNYLGSNFTPEYYSDLFFNKVNYFYTSKYANAAAWLVTSLCIKQIGFFDPMFKHYGEDDDYINRLHNEGLKLAIVPDSIIYHDRPQDGKRGDKFYENQIYTNALHLAKSTTKPKRHFILRKIIADYFSLFFVYLGKNENLKKKIKTNIYTLKLLSNYNK